MERKVNTNPSESQFPLFAGKRPGGVAFGLWDFSVNAGKGTSGVPSSDGDADDPQRKCKALQDPQVHRSWLVGKDYRKKHPAPVGFVCRARLAAGSQ